MGADVGVVNRPMHQGNEGALHKTPHTAGLITGHGDCQLGQPLANPTVIRAIVIPVDGVLQLVGQHLQIETGADLQVAAVNVNHLSLVAARADADRVLVGGAEITGGAPNGAVDYGQVGIIVHARLPFLPEVAGDPRVNYILKLGGGLFQVRLLHALPLLHVPVGVGRHQAQLKRRLVNLQLPHIDQPEFIPSASGVADRLRVDHPVNLREVGGQG